MVAKNGTKNLKESAFKQNKSTVSPSLGENKEASRVAERRSLLCQEAVKHVRKVVSEIANIYEKQSSVRILRKIIEQDCRLLRCVECLLTVSYHSRSYAVNLIIDWMKELQSKSKNSKYFLEEIKTSDTGPVLIYFCQLKTLQLLLDRILIEKREIPKNMIDEMLSLTVEQLLNVAKSWDNEDVSWIGSVVMACSDFLGSLSMFSLHEILARFNGKMFGTIGNTSLSALFNFRDSENENLFYLNVLKGLRISLADAKSTKDAIELLEFYRYLLTGSRSAAIKHMIADNVTALLLQNLHIEGSESTSMVKWYKTVDELYNLFHKWLTKPKHMAKGFPVCALLLKVKHVDVLKRELWPFFMRCCKQYEESKDLQLKIATMEALSHALNLYIKMKDPSSISTEQIQLILKKLLSPDRLFYQTNKDLYNVLAKCVIIVIHFSPHACIGILEDWWQSSKLISLSEVSYIFFQVVVLSLKKALCPQDEELYNSVSLDENVRAVEWSSEDKLKLAQMSCIALKTTHACLEKTRSQSLLTQDPSDIHCLLQLELKGIQCLLESIDENEVHSLYALVTDLACQTECTFIYDAESVMLDMCNQKANAEESILYQISLKFNFRKSNPLDISYASVERVIEVLNKVLALRKDYTSNNKLNEKPIARNLKSVLLRIQETLILLYFLPSVDLRRRLRDSFSMIQDVIFDRTFSELEEFSSECKLSHLSSEEMKPRSYSKGSDYELACEESFTTQFSRFLLMLHSFLSFSVKQSLESSKAGILNAEQMLLFLKGHFEQSLQGNAKLHDRFSGFHIVNISILESLELEFSLLFYILCSIDEQCKLTSSGVTREIRSQLRKIFQMVLSPSLLGIDGTKSPISTVYFSYLLEVLKNVPPQLSLYIALEVEELTISSPVVHLTKARSKRQKDQYRILYAKMLLALLDTLNDEDQNNITSGVLELYSRFFSKMLQIMTQAVENPQNPFDLMALRETFCQCLLKSLSLFISTSIFPVYFKGIWKDAMLLMQRWIASFNARKYSSASRGSSIFRTSFHDRSSREEALTVEDLQERIRRLSLICVTVLLGYADSFSISKELFHSVSFRVDPLFSSLLEEFKNFDSHALEKLHCDYSMLKPAFINILRQDRKSLQTLMELATLSNNHSNETIAYHASLLLLEYIRLHYRREDIALRNDQLCIEFFSLIYFIMGWDRQQLYPLALESLISLITVATKDFSYESSLEFHEYFPSLCQDENLINDISKRGAILCAEIASDIVNAVFSKVKQSFKDNTEYSHFRILCFLGPWLERGYISECIMEELVSLEETISETSRESKLMMMTFENLWHALGYRKDNLQRAIHVLMTALSQTLKKQSIKRNNEKLEMIRRAAANLSENHICFFLSSILSYILPDHASNERDGPFKDSTPEWESNALLFENIPNVIILLSEVVNRNSQDIRQFLPPIFHLATFAQTLNNISYQKHGRLLIANVISHFLLPYIERCCRQDIWRHCVQLSTQIALGMQQLATIGFPNEIAYSPEEMSSPRNGDLHLSEFLENLIELCSYSEPQLKISWSRYCLALIKYRLGPTFGVFSLRLYRLLGPCLDKDSVDILLSCARNEFYSSDPDQHRISQLLQILYMIATKIEKENLMTVPPMLLFAFELNRSKDLWIRLDAAYLFIKLYSIGNSVGAGIFHQLVETEFSNGLKGFPTMLEICKLAISTTQLQKSEHVIFLYVTLLLRIPWRQEASKQKAHLVPIIVTTLIFLTALLVSQNDDQNQRKDGQMVQLYSQTISEAELQSTPAEQSNSIVYFMITCIHLCYILKRLHLSALAEVLQNFCGSSRKHWKVEDFLYQLRSSLLSFWLENTRICEDVVIAWLETNNSPCYRRGVLRLMEAILVQAAQQQSILPRSIYHSSDIVKVLISSVDGPFHEEVIHLLELLD